MFDVHPFIHSDLKMFNSNRMLSLGSTFFLSVWLDQLLLSLTCLDRVQIVIFPFVLVFLFIWSTCLLFIAPIIIIIFCRNSDRATAKQILTRTHTRTPWFPFTSDSDARCSTRVEFTFFCCLPRWNQKPKQRSKYSTIRCRMAYFVFCYE